MNKQDIIQEPNKKLHEQSSKIDNLAEARKIVQELIEVIKSVDKPWNIWLGMAAPQIGINRRVIVLKESYENYTVMINPEVLGQKWLFPIFSRCFSLKGIYLIKAHLWIKVRYQDLEGKYHIEVIKYGRAATLEQEINHINGMLVSDIGIRLC